jgi:hypothetical protein
MKSFYGLVFVFAVLHSSRASELVRRKRFFGTLWPSEEVKSDIGNGMVYAQLPPEYLHLLSGVNDQRMVQRRAGVQVPVQQPPRFVHPTRMAILMQPQYQPHQAPAQPVPNLKTQPANIQPGPKIVMKPFAPNLSPSIALKTREQPLPDIHKNQRFVAPKPMAKLNQKPQVQPFNPQQQLPIKKSFENSPAIVTAPPLLTIKTAPITDFYYTKEFQELLKEFKIKVDIQKLPEISEVMTILGTENAEETIAGIRNVAESKEGMELIKSYLDQSSEHDEDEFYNYDEDVGAGEIQVGGTEDVQSYQVPQTNFDQKPTNVPLQQYNVPQEFSAPAQPFIPVRASTTGTLTGTGNSGKSWWKPTTWFNSAPSTRVESLQKDSEIFRNVVRVGGVRDNLQYIRNFLTPSSRDNIPLDAPRRIFLQQPQPLRFEHSSVVSSDAKIMPTVQMSEAQFQDMVKTLKLTPMNNQQVKKAPKPVTKVNQVAKANQVKFASPINVQSVKTEIPLPTTFERQPEEPKTILVLPEESPRKENRRNFISVSEPQRAAPYDFIATGRVHQANPDEVLKRSRSLVEKIEGET